MGSTNKIETLTALNASLKADNTARNRLLRLFDADSFVELDAFVKAGENEAGVVAGYGLVEGAVVYAFSQDVSADSGAVNAAHAKKIIKVYELAAKTGCPVVCVYDSKGAKISEGNDMLAAYSEMLACAGRISGVVPQIAVVLGTCAGASALLAGAADVLIMSENAELFLTAPFISAANGDSAEDAGSAKAAQSAGVASIVKADEDEALACARKVLTMLPQNNLASLPLFDFAESSEVLDAEGCPKKVVAAVADADSLVELYAGYANSMYTFLGTVAGATTGFVTTSKNNPIDANGCDKTARFVKMCDAFNIPVVTFVNSEGFVKDANVSVVKDAVRLAGAYAEATTPKISVLSGKAFGPAYLALGSKNANAYVTIAWPQAVISALDPKTAVEFLWADRFKGTEDVKATREALREEFENTVASPFTAAADGHVEAVIAPEETRKALINLLDMLAGKRESTLPKKHMTF